MRKTLSRIALAAAAVLLLGSCSKINGRIDDLEGRIDGIENETIKTIDGQIASINSSIADLGTIRSNIQDLKSKTESQAGQIGELQDADTQLGKKIEALESADEAIGERIDNLQKYVDDTLKAYATTEWVNATFSTLAQYEATCDTIAKIDARIGDLDTRLSKAIEDCADSLKAWVNVQLGAYYTAAQMDATVAELQAAIDTASAVAAATADSISAELSATKAAIDTAKANIRTEYRAAIDTAISASEGKLTRALQDEIAIVNRDIASLDRRVTKLETDVRALTGRVDALENMIQSVVIVPAYSDGSVKVDDDSLYIDFIVNPVSAVANLKADSVTVLVTKVLTKAFPSVDSIKIGANDLFEKDAAKGAVSVRVSVAGKLPAAADSTITVAVNVKNGISNYTTEFVSVYVKRLPAGALKGMFTVNAVGKKVNFSQGNLWYGKLEGATETTWNLETNQYEFTPTTSNTSWNPDHISHFFWSKTESVTYASLYSESGISPNDVFFTNSDVETANTNFTVNGVTGKYRTLSKDEWNYLFNTRTMANEGARYEMLTLSSINVQDITFKGVVLFPDDFTEQGTWKTKYTTWEALNKAGLVFLPAAGDRQGSSVLNVGEYSRYWSSSTKDGTNSVYKLNFYDSTVDPYSDDSRGYGFCIRLVTDVE